MAADLVQMLSERMPSDDSLPASPELGAVVLAAAARVLAVIEENPDASVDELDALRRRWDGFVAASDLKRQAGAVTAHQVGRRLDVEIGRRLLDMEGDEIPRSLRPDLSTLRLLAKYSDVVEQVVEQSTNARPPTRNRCLAAIRWHRELRGEVTRRPRNEYVKQGRYPDPMQPPVGIKLSLPDADRLARAVRSDMSIVYGQIRAAQSTHATITDPADYEHSGALRDALRRAFEHAVALMHAELRRRADAQRPPAETGGREQLHRTSPSYQQPGQRQEQQVRTQPEVCQIKAPEVTPGDLGRMVLHDDPQQVAREVAAWANGTIDPHKVVRWFVDLVRALDRPSPPDGQDGAGATEAIVARCSRALRVGAIGLHDDVIREITDVVARGDDVCYLGEGIAIWWDVDDLAWSEAPALDDRSTP